MSRYRLLGTFSRCIILPTRDMAASGIGIPTVGYITVPPYIISAARGHHLDKFDAHRMYAEIGILMDLLHIMARIDTEHIKSA